MLATLRRRGLKTPVLILTARDAVEDRVQGLDGGADDYLVKPCVALTPDGRTLLLTTQMTGDLTLVDPVSLAVRGRVAVGRNPNWVGVTADGRHAVVSNTDDDSAVIVDIAAMKVVAASRVGRQPKRLVVGTCPP